jgi:radical SAM superfamily enzyme YgiQ (UPF0313 family)
MKKSFRQIEKYRKAKLSAERTKIIIKDAPLRACLVFPSTYRVGMSNLAVHSLYGLMNSRKDTCCERSFSDEPLTGYSLESGSPLAGFDIIAFSVSFELDYPKILHILHAAGIPLHTSERNESHPLIIAGGPCIFSNPEPIADFVDAFAVGEGEELMHDILDCYAVFNPRTRSRADLLDALSQIPGIYIPSFYVPVYDGGGALTGMGAKGGPKLPVTARVVPELDRYPCASVILTPNTEFANMFLIELGRGCRRGCKFCSACSIYYRRNRSVDAIIRTLEEAGEETAQRVGFVTSDFSDYPHREKLLDFLMNKKKAFSVSSIRADAITDDILEGIRQSSQRTLTLAPEVASEKLRSLTGKRISVDVLLGVVERALQREIYNFRLYFMIGFPQEDDEDVQAIGHLAAQVQKQMRSAAKKTHKIGKLTLSVNPFVPKPFTPMEAEPFADHAVLARRIRALKSRVARIGNTSLLVESPRAARLQSTFARGDRRAAHIVESAARGASITQIMREYRKEIEKFAGRQPEKAGMRPWHVISPPSAQRRKREKEGFN